MGLLELGKFAYSLETSLRKVALNTFFIFRDLNILKKLFGCTVKFNYGALHCSVMSLSLQGNIFV